MFWSSIAEFCSTGLSERVSLFRELVRVTETVPLVEVIFFSGVCLPHRDLSSNIVTPYIGGVAQR